jgi:hypothetical protein
MSETIQNKTNSITLNQYLKNFSKDELIREILELSKTFGSVKDYYQIKLSPQKELLISEKYKKIIQNEFFPTRGIGKARLSVAKKAIVDFIKVSETPTSVVDIMLFYVEQGVKFTNAYGDINEPFYESMEKMYEVAVECMSKHKIKEAFKERCRKIVEDTSDMGWGFYDNLEQLYRDAFKGLD